MKFGCGAECQRRRCKVSYFDSAYTTRLLLLRRRRHPTAFSHLPAGTKMSGLDAQGLLCLFLNRTYEFCLRLNDYNLVNVCFCEDEFIEILSFELVCVKQRDIKVPCVIF